MASTQWSQSTKSSRSRASRSIGPGVLTSMVAIVAHDRLDAAGGVHVSSDATAGVHPPSLARADCRAWAKASLVNVAPDTTSNCRPWAASASLVRTGMAWELMD